MRLSTTSIGLREHRLIGLEKAPGIPAAGGDGAYLEPLGGWQRTKESTFGAASNVLGGAGQVITGKDGRFKGLLRIGEGVFDAFDVIPSAAADGIRNLAGTPSNPHKPSGFHISRALRHGADLRTDDPVNALKDTAVVVADNIHAIGFKSGSDLLRLMRRGIN